MVWDKLISRNDQIFMVLSGHQHAQARRTDENHFGHKVYQILSDYQARWQTGKEAGAKLQRGEGIGDGWMRLMTFDMTPETPVVKVRTYSTHYRKLSREAADYANWYRADERPQMTDAQFLAADEFSINLTDFRARFDKTARH